MTGDSFHEEYVKDSKNAVANLYRSERSNFFAFAAKWALPENEVADIYQDAIIAFIENMRKGRVTINASTPTTYLFAIGKYMAIKRLKDKLPASLEDVSLPLGFLYEDAEHYRKEEQYHRIKKAMEQLGAQCKKILTLYYYESKDLDKMMEILNYEKKDVLKSQKSRCLKQLREKCNETE